MHALPFHKIEYFLAICLFSSRFLLSTFSLPSLPIMRCHTHEERQNQSGLALICILFAVVVGFIMMAYGFVTYVQHNKATVMYTATVIDTDLVQTDDYYNLDVTIEFNTTAVGFVTAHFFKYCGLTRYCKRDYHNGDTVKIYASPEGKHVVVGKPNPAPYLAVGILGTIMFIIGFLACIASVDLRGLIDGILCGMFR